MTWLIHRLEIPNQTKDQRDRDAFPDFEGGGLPFEHHLPTAGTSLEPNVSLRGNSNEKQTDALSRMPGSTSSSL